MMAFCFASARVLHVWNKWTGDEFATADVSAPE
jgi:hypothetical protein